MKIPIEPPFIPDFKILGPPIDYGPHSIDHAPDQTLHGVNAQCIHDPTKIINVFPKVYDLQKCAAACGASHKCTHFSLNKGPVWSKESEVPMETRLAYTPSAGPPSHCYLCSGPIQLEVANGMYSYVGKKRLTPAEPGDFRNPVPLDTLNGPIQSWIEGVTGTKMQVTPAMKKIVAAVKSDVHASLASKASHAVVKPAPPYGIQVLHPVEKEIKTETFAEQNNPLNPKNYKGLSYPDAAKKFEDLASNDPNLSGRGPTKSVGQDVLNELEATEGVPATDPGVNLFKDISGQSSFYAPFL